MNRDKTLIYVHIHKTAGSTVRTAIERVYGRDKTLKIYNINGLPLEEFRAMSQEERDRYDCVIGHFSYGIHRYLGRPSEYATMLREPVDRAVSLYYYIKRNPNVPLHRKLVSERISLERYIEEDECGRQANPQVRFVTGESGSDPALARIYLADRYAAFGLAERFDESMVMFQRAFGWQTPYYTSRNVTKGRPRLADLPERLLAKVKRQHAADVELYRDARELFDRRVREQERRYFHDLVRLKRVNFFYAARLKPVKWLKDRLRAIRGKML
ncbi:MAG: sulfotransferase family 2 domain-containing protein [Candidatus Margulisiibacteriota bacterium]